MDYNNYYSKYQIRHMTNAEVGALPTYTKDGKLRKAVAKRIQQVFGDKWNQQTSRQKPYYGGEPDYWKLSDLILQTLRKDRIGAPIRDAWVDHVSKELGLEPAQIKQAYDIARDVVNKSVKESIGAPFYMNELDKKDAFKKLYASLIGLRESLKLHHLSTNSWQDHLATDKAYDGIDDLIDTLGEVYFLPRGIDMRDIKITDEDYNAVDPAALAMAINGWADNLANSIDDNGLINYLNGLSQEMQVYVGWLRLGMKDGLQDAEIEKVVVPTVESTKNTARAKVESLDDSEIEYLARDIDDGDLEVIGSLAEATVGDCFTYRSRYYSRWLEVLVLNAATKNEALSIFADRVRAEMEQDTDWVDGSTKRAYKKLAVGDQLDGWLKISDGDTATLIDASNLRQQELSESDLNKLREELESRSNKYRFVPAVDPRQTLMFGEGTKKSRMRAFAESVLNA